jgi:co-chaperonin GroES (HSP10)
MNFAFHIIRLGGINKRCQFYTILKDGEELTEASKFLTNERNKQSDDISRLNSKVDAIRNKVGARISFFKYEGNQQSLVHALHAGTKKEGYLQLNHLRWYCIRLSERCVIFGNGGVKHVGKTQQDSHLKEKEKDMRWVDTCVYAAFMHDELHCDDNGHLVGNLEFTRERVQNYDLR